MRRHCFLPALCIFTMLINNSIVIADVHDLPQVLTSDLQLFISKISVTDIENPAQLSTWLLGFFLSYDNFRYCSKMKTCETDTEPFVRIERIRQKIDKYLHRNTITIKKFRKLGQDYLTPVTLEEPVLDQRNSEPDLTQQTFQEHQNLNQNEENVNNPDNPRFNRMNVHSQEQISWYPRSSTYGPIGSQNVQWGPVKFVTRVESVVNHNTKHDLIQCQHLQVCVNPHNCHEGYLPHEVSIEKFKIQVNCFFINSSKT